MKKPELTKEESDAYVRIVRFGNMDDMFDLAYSIGREQLAKDLTKKENWTPELRYVHKSRLIVGLILGFLLGTYIRLFF